ncbi:SDR family NAD(P)-dependent oxidoreductase [candidate division WWE3 bacterium]|nr:SDR family NAD(P)-dependent oxidoreductase [candidate division WWE3 bacterium]
MIARDKTFLVTGGGSGIGRALVLELLSRGATVITIDLNEKGLQETTELAQDKKDRVSTYVLNITDKDAVEAFLDKIVAEHDHIDGLINNAGIIQPFVKINDLSYDAINKVMTVNFYGMLYMTKTFLPHLLTRPEAHLVNVSSMGGFVPVPGQCLYCASKAAVKLFTEGLQAELADTSVNVSVVFPGATSTNITKNSGVTSPVSESQGSSSYKTLLPEQAAQIIVNGIENNQIRIFVGSDSKMMNLLYRLNPRYATNLIAKQMKSLLK